MRDAALGFELLALLGASWDQVPNSCHSALAHEPLISVPGMPALRGSGSQPARLPSLLRSLLP